MRRQATRSASHLLCEMFMRTAARPRALKRIYLSDCTHSHNPPVAGALGWWSADVVDKVWSPPGKVPGEVALKSFWMACQLAQLDLPCHGGANNRVRQKRRVVDLATL